MATTAGQTLHALATENPHVDVVRYEHKNQKFTLKHVDYFADALAVGFLDTGLKPGDAVLSWLPQHFSEQHILQFACSKAGLVLYHLDPSTSSTDEALSAALTLTSANVLITQEAGNNMNYIDVVEKVIPEIRIFDVGDGLPFFTPRYPHLRFPIHTGFEYAVSAGMIPLKDMLCPTGQSEKLAMENGGGVALSGKTPLMGELVLDGNGVPVKLGKVLSNDEVLKGNLWPEVSSILKKDYFEVEGVGVVF